MSDDQDGCEWVSFFWYRPTRVVPDQQPLNGCVRVLVCVQNELCVSYSLFCQAVHWCHQSRCWRSLQKLPQSWPAPCRNSQSAQDWTQEQDSARSTAQQQQQQSLNSPLSRTNWVSWYWKKTPNWKKLTHSLPVLTAESKSLIQHTSHAEKIKITTAFYDDVSSFNRPCCKGWLLHAHCIQKLEELSDLDRWLKMVNQLSLCKTN